MTPTSITIRAAAPHERTALEELQRRASLDGPMYRAQLTAHPDAIELPATQIAEGLVRVAEEDGRIAGFAVLLGPIEGRAELDGLFVEPDRMGTGIGRRLIGDASRIARGQGATEIWVVANPQALAFYERVGFRRTGEAETRFGPAAVMSLQVGEL